MNLGSSPRPAVAWVNLGSRQHLCLVVATTGRMARRVCCYAETPDSIPTRCHRRLSLTVHPIPKGLVLLCPHRHKWNPFGSVLRNSNSLCFLLLLFFHDSNSLCFLLLLLFHDSNSLCFLLLLLFHDSNSLCFLLLLLFHDSNSL